MISTLRGRVARLRTGYLARPFTSIQLLLLSGAMLLTFGVLMAVSTSLSSSLHQSARGTMWTQVLDEAMFICLGAPVLWLGVRIPPRIYRMLAYPVLLLATMLMVAVLIPHVGVSIYGARRWLRIGPLQIQPSEFAKLAMLLWGADLLARKHALGTLHRPRHILVPLLPGFALMSALVMLEPDLGTTLCFLLILMSLLWTIGLPLRYFGGVLVLVVAAVTLLAIVSPYRLDRLTSFVDPFKDASGQGFQAVHGLYALSSGGVLGVGLGSGPSKWGWVSNANSDYVFAIIGEELGLLGCLVVLASFGLFAYAALRVARRSDDEFVRLAAGGCGVWICGQALINVGYVTGLLPVTGIPLPFVSAGGTSLVLTMGVLGMLLSFARHEPDAVGATLTAVDAGERARWIGLLGLGRPRPNVRPRRRPAREPARPIPRAPAASPRAAQARPRAAQAAPRPAPARPRGPRTRDSDTSLPLPATGTDSPRSGRGR